MNIKELFDAAKAGKAAVLETKFDRQDKDELEARREAKANEVMHTGNTGFGEEFIPAEQFAQDIIDIMPEQPGFLSALPGNHGTGLPKVYTSAAIGLSVADLEFEGRSEWTTGTASDTESDHSQQKAATKSITLTQKGFILEVDIADDQLQYNAVNTEQYVKERIARAAVQLAEKLIINGDSETGATGNVNLDDAAPASTKYYLKIDGGLRERAINSSYNVNVGTLTASDYSDILAVMGWYGIYPEDCLFLQHPSVTHKMRTIDEVETKDLRGDNATILKGWVGNIYGVDIINHIAVPLTEADGKVSTTAGNNTLGQICAMYKPAVQYGWGRDFKLEVVRVAGYGYRLVATMDFAFTIIDSEGSLANPSIAVGRNITV